LLITVGVSTLVSVFSSALVGAFLVLAPWTPWWESNLLLQANHTLRAVLLSEFTRGAVSGLGLVNLLLAGLDARQYLQGRGRFFH
jgi:hypothetical protein